MKKVVYTVCVNNYFPELMEITLLNLEAFAKRIGAEFHVIKERKYPDFSPTYEKLQVYELGKDNDWNILVDADQMLHPNFWDVTANLPPDHVAFHTGFEASTRFITDQYFLRDGRDRGITTSFVVSSNLCHDLWTPLEFGWDIAKTKTNREHIIDEYCLSRNLAKFGLKYSGILFDDSEQYLIEHLCPLGRTDEEVKNCISKARSLQEQWSKL